VSRGGLDGSPDLASYVALEASDGFSGCAAFGGAAGKVVLGGLVASLPGLGDGVDGGVEGSVTPAIEAVAYVAAGAGGYRVDAGESGEGGFGADAAGVRPGGEGDRGGDRPMPGWSSRAGHIALTRFRICLRLSASTRFRSRMRTASSATLVASGVRQH
jgi:hypothetical protein